MSDLQCPAAIFLGRQIQGQSHHAVVVNIRVPEDPFVRARVYL